MPVESIEVICPACPKCDRAVQTIAYALKLLNVNVPVVRITDLKAISETSVGVSKTPIIRINGRVEFAGVIPDIPVLKIRLNELKTD